jgi:hypothetical protein
LWQVALSLEEEDLQIDALVSCLSFLLSVAQLVPLSYTHLARRGSSMQICPDTNDSHSEYIRPYLGVSCRVTILYALFDLLFFFFLLCAGGPFSDQLSSSISQALLSFAKTLCSLHTCMSRCLHCMFSFHNICRLTRSLLCFKGFYCPPNTAQPMYCCPGYYCSNDTTTLTVCPQNQYCPTGTVGGGVSVMISVLIGIHHV